MVNRKYLHPVEFALMLDKALNRGLTETQQHDLAVAVNDYLMVPAGKQVETMKICNINTMVRLAG